MNFMGHGRQTLAVISGGGGRFAGGGGGGRYYGGGSDGECGRTYYGQYGYCAWSGGGGGSSFIEQAAATIKNIQGGAPIGDGRVVISW
jgi:hypothetical protein